MVQVQRPKLAGYFDIITVSAGGNDVGFSDVLKACMFLPSSVDNCNQAINDASVKIDSLHIAVRGLLETLRYHLTFSGVIIWTLYAKFFDETPLPCNDQEWCFTAGMPCLKSTVDLRQAFNYLVWKTNKVIVDTIESWKKDSGFPDVSTVHWGAFVVAANGQFCEADSTRGYNDESNTKLAFIRPSMDGPPLD